MASHSRARPGGWLLRALPTDRRGAVAIIFALTLIPVLGFIGGAIDYARAYAAKTKLQTALDAAILAAGATLAMTEEERIAYAKQVFEANYPPGKTAAPATPVINISAEGVITGSVDAKLPSAILGLLGITDFKVAAESEARIVSKIDGEVVLVLDYSGSMGSKGKYQAMRDAAIDLVNTLSQKGTNDKVKFGLVPFAGEVYTTLPNEYVIDQTGFGNWTACTADRKWPFNTQDSTPTSDDETKWGYPCPEQNNGKGKGAGKGKGKGKGKGNQPPACTVYDHCTAYSARNVIIRPLTNDFPAVINQLKAMTPGGYTHISLALEFGWHVISPNPPYSEGVSYGTEDVLKAIVLLTDGQQTSPGWGPGESHNVTKAEKNLEDLCTNVKAKDVMLITVAFDLKDKATLNRLRDCATSSNHFFDASTNSDLAQAFQAITGHLVKNLHLSR